MATINQMLERVRAVGTSALHVEIASIIESDADELTGYVKSQLRQGELSTGAKITPGYKSNYYARKKLEQNSAPGFGTPDAYRTGEYYREMGVIASGDEYIIDSNVTRKNLLQYGDNLTRLSDAHKAQYAQGTLARKIKEFIVSKVGNIYG